MSCFCSIARRVYTHYECKRSMIKFALTLLNVGGLVRLGDLDFHIFSAGQLLLDGGAMFGMVPKTLWEAKIPADSSNRICLAMNCLLIRTAGKTILVDTGAGGKIKKKLRDIYGLDGPHLISQLRQLDVEPSDIDIVIDTHLHFDHAGGNTVVEGDRVVPTFPRAEYIVQMGEYEHAVVPTERDRAGFFRDDYIPLFETGKLSLITGDRMIVPGVEVIRVPGHTADMQSVKLTGGGQTAFFFSDLVPTVAHLSSPWISGYDLYPMDTLENKKKWISRVTSEGWIALFAHDSKTQAAYIHERNGQLETEPLYVR